MFKKWDAQQGKFIDIRYSTYDEQKYPNRKYLKYDCDGCDKTMVLVVILIVWVVVGALVLKIKLILITMKFKGE